jgi:hypothetical protein
MMTAKEASKALGCSVRTLNRYVHKEMLTATTEGRKTMYCPTEIVNLSNKINKEKQKNGREPQVIKNNKPFGYDLDDVGKEYVSICKQELQSLGIYHSSDDISLYELGMQYQLYRDYLDASREEGNFELAKLSNLHYKNVEGQLKQLGLTPQARKQLGISINNDKSKDIFDDLKDLLA